MATQIARGTRGHITDDRSITARRYNEGLLLKEARAAAITRTKNWLASGEPVELIILPAPDNRVFAIPRPVVEFLSAEED
jgi:hypothetical protein